MPWRELFNHNKKDYAMTAEILHLQNDFQNPALMLVLAVVMAATFPLFMLATS